MDATERGALQALSFNWVPTSDDVWRPAPFHVEALHQSAMQLVLDGLRKAADSGDSSPVGVVVLGQRGAGKTHLLGAVRERVQAAGGYFFLVSMLDVGGFWRSVALSMLNGLIREVPTQPTQLQVSLHRLVDLLGAPRSIRRAVVGDTVLSRAALDAFVDLLRKANRQVGLECQDTARALALTASEKPSEQDTGYYFLCSNDEEEPGERAAWGIRRARRSAQEIVRDMSQVLALTGPTVVAVDQIDPLIAQSAKATAGDATQEWREALLLEQIAGGLMSLREFTRRTLSVVACLPASWENITAKATDTVQDRFDQAHQLHTIPNEELGRELVEKRFTASFAKIGFTPDYPTWPVRPGAFRDAHQFTPRALLKTIDSHVKACLRTGQVRELDRLVLSPPTTALPTPEQESGAQLLAEPVYVGDLADLDARFDALVRRADPGPALDPNREDKVVPELLSAGLTAWIAEHDDPAGRVFSQDPPPGAKPALHARLRRSLDESREDEQHWAFRAVGATHHIAALNRIRNAATAAGLTEGITKRRLFLLREPGKDWSHGPRTREVLAAFEAAGGRTLPFPEDDIKVLVALRDMLQNTPRERSDETVQRWLALRHLTDRIGFLRDALAGAADGLHVPARPADLDPHAVTLGTALANSAGDPAARVTVKLEALRRHVAVFAGSGSGKTVLIRRLVEECALHGVSAIVLDPNNDLARLGDPWPEPPAGWGEGDADRAEQYLETVEVVVWTPRREAGRPLSFQPLPDFSGVVDDPDEFAAGIDAAVAALAPRAKVAAQTSKADLGRAVLREALTYYARRGRSDLNGFIGLLSALPDGASRLENAEKIAAEMAQLLTAATVNDPLFGGTGAPVDPGLLLSPSDGKRARISVVSLIGLTLDEQRQSFVNQLQLALFAWIKRHPAGDRPLGGLFVMDEAQTLAPSGAMTACTASTLALVSQARKYGLGLVFATQAPKALHNRIPGNAATQLFGLINSPVQIAAAREMARAKGSDIPDIGRLDAGQFYAAVEGSALTKLQAPLCLTHHPRSPLTGQEVVERARRAS